jgi:hypothetical protein
LKTLIVLTGINFENAYDIPQRSPLSNVVFAVHFFNQLLWQVLHLQYGKHFP